MFRIDSKQAIKISKGDTVYFPLFLNKGTAKKPIRYAFKKGFLRTSVNNPTLRVEINQEIWKTVVTEDGDYSFIYTDNGWKLNDEVVDLIYYGITLVGTPAEYDKIIVHYTKPDAGEVHFYVLNINLDPKHPVLEKIYKSNGEIISKRFKRKEEVIISTENNNVNENGDMIITLEPEDTDYMYEGEYKYEIKAYLKNDAEDEYSINTVTNRLPFVVVNDDYASNFIYR